MVIERLIVAIYVTDEEGEDEGRTNKTSLIMSGLSKLVCLLTM